MAEPSCPQFADQSCPQPPLCVPSTPPGLSQHLAPHYLLPPLIWVSSEPDDTHMQIRARTRTHTHTHQLLLFPFLLPANPKSHQRGCTSAGFKGMREKVSLRLLYLEGLCKPLPGADKSGECEEITLLCVMWNARATQGLWQPHTQWHAAMLNTCAGDQRAPRQAGGDPSRQHTPQGPEPRQSPGVRIRHQPQSAPAPPAVLSFLHLSDQSHFWKPTLLSREGS